MKHIFKLIWADRRANAWILVELTLGFCILWFCTDYLYFMGKRYLEPLGFDIEHTYKINIGINQEKYATMNEDGARENFRKFYELIERHPAVDCACVSSNWTFPYSGSNSDAPFKVDSAIDNAQLKHVSPDYFKVFKINTLWGRTLDINDAITGNTIVIGPAANNLFIQKPVEEVRFVELGDNKFNVVGAVQKTRIDDYRDYNNVTYWPLQKDGDVRWLTQALCIRVKPGADNNFPLQFAKEMRSQLEVGPFYLMSVTPMRDIRENYMQREGYSSRFRSIYVVSTFLIINIFLGVIGPFWFRVQSRYSEIGLRAALGASKTRIRKLFIGETLLLLFVASIVAAVLSANIALADVVKNIGALPVPSREGASVEVLQYFINYLITFLFLMLIAILAVWYPAKKASDIQPTEALRDE